MKTSLLYFTIAVCLLYSANCFSQWVAQTAPAGTSSLYSVFALSPSAVACAGTTKVIKTADGGATWTSPLTLGGVNIYTVHSGTSTFWYSLTANATWGLKVMNPGGISLYGGKPDSVLALHFNTPACATAVGIAGKIKTTCDTGLTWQVRTPGTLLNQNSVWYATPSVGATCGVFGSISRTINGGATWASVTSPSTQNLNGISFADSTTGYIVGNVGVCLKTINAGLSWNTVPTGVTNNLNGVYFIDTDTGYVVGSGGLIMKTINGGTSWTTMTSGTTNILRSVHFFNSSAGWVVGDGATILKYCPTISITGSISGPTTVCAGDSISYTVPAAAGASSYTWSFPAGWSGSSATNTVTVIAGATAGNVHVVANNTCGGGAGPILAITNNTPPVPTISQTLNVLTSSSATGNQWYLNGIIIPGATSQTFSFTANGSYTVVVTSLGCSATSAPKVITNAGIEEFTANSVSISPNPFSESITITGIGNETETIEIINVLGERISKHLTQDETQWVVDTHQLPPGIYFVRIHAKKGNITKKIIKQ